MNNRIFRIILGLALVLAHMAFGPATGQSISAPEFFPSLPPLVPAVVSLLDGPSPAEAVVAQPTVNVALYGAWGDGSHDDTSAIQAAINYENSIGGGTVIFPQGTFRASTITLKSKVLLKGAGRDATIIKPTTSANAYLFTIPAGPVIKPGISDMWIDGGSVNAGQGCFYINAQASAGSPFNGGMWYGQFRNLTISGFAGHSFWFRGDTGGSFLLPNQFCILEHVTATRGSTSSSRALLMTGECNQFKFINCEFGGTALGASGVNIEIGREFNNAGTVGGSTVGGSAVSSNAPNLISFDMLTSQASDKAVLCDNAADISVTNSWLENLYHAINAINNTTGLSVERCNFANAASDGAAGGYGVKFETTSSGRVLGNYFHGNVDTAVIGSSHYGVQVAQNMGGGSSSGLTVQLNDAATLTTHLSTNILVNTGATAITTITSDLGVGETITLRAWTGTLPFATGGNLDLGGQSSMTLQNKETATFQRADLGDTWVLQSVGMARGVDTNSAQTIAGNKTFSGATSFTGNTGMGTVTGSSANAKLEIQDSTNTTELLYGSAANQGMLHAGTGGAFFGWGWRTIAGTQTAESGTCGYFKTDNAGAATYAADTGRTVGAAWTPTVRWTVDVSGNETATGTVKGTNGIIAGSSGTTITQIKVYTPSLTPAAVAANTSAEQTFTVTGLTTADTVYINRPSATAGLGIVGVRVSAADTLAITFGNFTAGSLTPASGTYRVVAMRS